MMRKFGKLGSVGNRTQVQRAISYLRKLNTSPANINDANGWMQRPGNLLRFSSDLTSGFWGKAASSATAYSLTFTASAAAQAAQTVALTVAQYTIAALVSVASGTKTFRLKYWNGTVDVLSPDFVATTTPTTQVFSITGVTNTGNVALINGTTADAGAIIVGGVGLFAGTLTASQILAMGGIPLTTSAASTAEYTRANTWDFGVPQGPLAYAATHTAAEFLAQYPAWHLYQDTAGTIPACKINDPVGLCLDTGSGGVVLGPELVTGNSSTFSSGLGSWAAGNSASLSVVSGVMRVQHNGKNYPLAALNIPTVAGNTYMVVFSVAKGTSAQGVAMRISDSFFGGGGSQLADSMYKTISGDYLVVFRATSSQSYLWAIVNTTVSGAYDDIDNISVREVIGAHASQATTTKRPILSGRVNLLTATEDFSSASWVKRGSCTVTINATPSPVSGTNACLISGLSSGGVNDMYWGPYSFTTPTVSASLKASIRIKRVSTSGIIMLSHPTNQTFGSWEINLSLLADAWEVLTSTHPAVTVVNPFTSNSAGNYGFIFSTKAGAVVSLYLWGADLRPANSPTNIPAYQRVTSTSDYDTVGFPVRALFDGVDDCLVVPSLDLSMTDKVTVVAGVTKLSDAAAGMILEHGATFGAQGTFYIAAAETSGDYSFQGKGSTSGARISKTGFVAPHSGVLSTKADISGSSRSARVNGGAYTTNTTTLGTGNLSVNALNIGARNGGASLPFSGAIQRITLINKLSSDPEVALLEAMTNTQMGKVY